MVEHRQAYTRGFDWYRLLPKYWLQNDPTDREWDALLNRLLDRGVSKVGTYTVRFGNVEVWISNWPYAYGNLYTPVRARGLPLVRTRKRLRRIVRETRNYSEYGIVYRMLEGEA